MKRPLGHFDRSDAKHRGAETRSIASSPLRKSDKILFILDSSTPALWASTRNEDFNFSHALKVQYSLKIVLFFGNRRIILFYPYRINI